MNKNKKDITNIIIKTIQRSISNNKSNGLIRLNKPISKEILIIKKYFDIDVTNWNRILLDNDIRHMLKEHGNKNIEKMKGQIAITTKDIEKIQEIINTYDNIIKGNLNREGNSIIFIKKYNKIYLYLTEIIIINKKILKIKTMWKKQSIVANSKTPSTTSKTDDSNSHSSLSKKNIS